MLAVLALAGVALAGASGAAHPALARSSVSPATVTPDDWPTYLHDPQRTAASSETILSPANAGQLTKLWSYKTGGVIAASATVVGGTVYVGSWDGYEYALDAATGALKWKTYLGVTSAPTCNPPAAGITSAATVQNGVVYVGGGDAYWYALDAITGAVLWRVFTGDNSATGGHYNWASPLLYNGYAYIGVASLGDCPLVQGQLLQVSLSTQQVVNTFNVVPTGQVGGGIWTSPSLDPATNTIFVTTGTEASTAQPYAQALLAIDAATLTLKASWKLPESQAVPDSDFGTTPILFNDATGNPLVAAINKNGVAYALNRNNIAAGPVWQQSIAVGGFCPQCGEGSVSSGAFANGTLFLAGGNTTINGMGYLGAVRALDPATGGFLWQHGAVDTVFAALAYVNGLVIDGAGSLLEVLNAASGARLYSYQTNGTIYGAPSVSNGEIFAGSVDGNIYAFGLPATPPPPPPPDPNCPSAWVCQDVGSPAPAGSETVSGGTWSVSAGGAGVGGTSDQFRLLTQAASGDVQVTAQALTLPSVGAGSQAGVMLRQSADPTSPYYAVFVTPNNGLVVQYRTAFGGATAVANRLSTGSLPLFLEIQRVGDMLQAATSSDGVTYTLVPGTTVTLVMLDHVQAGLAVSSGSNGTAGTASFAAALVGSPNNSPAPPPPTTPCPTGWSCAGVGNPAPVGGQSLSNGVWTVQGGGSDIWSGTDQFHYVWQALAGDGTLSAHITSQGNTSTWAKAGVMLRQSTAANAAYYALLVTPSNGIVVQYRTTMGLSTQQIAVPGAAPTYVEVARSGTTFTAYTSSDGVVWTPIAGSSVALANLSGSLLAGLAVTAHNSGALSTVTFDTVSLAAGCPGSWSCVDVGSPALAGSQSLSNGVWTVQGGGSDIWGTADHFHYVWQGLAADGSVSARVTSQTNTSTWAKAGVMLRSSTAPNAAYYAVFVTPGNGIAVQYRATPGASAAQLAQIAGAAPAYLRVGRSGTTFTAYTSSDGVVWTPIAGTSLSLTSLSGTLLAGLAVTAHNSGALSTVTFNTVSLSVGCPSGWSCADVGSPALAGSQTLSGSIWTVQGGGVDIWGTADQFHLVWQGLAADGSLSAHVTSQTNTDPWAKAGVMLRLSTDPSAPYYAAYVTAGNGISVQYRATQAGSAIQIANIAGAVPAYLKVGRTGTTFTAHTSSDGVTWTPIAGSSVALGNLSGSLLAGLAVTAHNGGALSTVTFDTVALSASAPPPPPCLSGWTCADIGAPLLAGSQSLSNGVWTVQGGGSDIWGTADQFHFVWQALAADGGLVAHVTSQTNTSTWAKAGVMLRLSTDPSAPYYAVFVTPGHGIAVQYRAAQGASAAQRANVAGAVPAYLRVGRTGTTFTAYTSTDSVTWTAIPGSSISLPGLSGSLLAGLAVTAHNGGALSTATFDTVAPTTSAAPASPTAAPTATATPTSVPTVTPTPIPTARPTPSATPPPTASPTATPSPVPGSSTPAAPPALPSPSPAATPSPPGKP